MAQVKPREKDEVGEAAPRPEEGPEGEDALTGDALMGDTEGSTGGLPNSWLVYIGDEARNALAGYPANFVKTSHYTLFNFLPLNLFHQFQNLQNLYFLVVMLFSIVGDSPVTPASAIVPLVLVLTVSAVKEGWEDFKRHQADAEDNSGLVKVLKGDQWVATASMDVKIGDVILLERNATVKADVVILSSDDEDSVVYIETSQLDGESNVKTRKALPETHHIQTPADVMQMLGTRADGGGPGAAQGVDPECGPYLEIDAPNPRLYTWQGVLQMGATRLALSTKNAIWRGSNVRKCNWAVCVVIYTGPVTKQGLNLRPTKQKYSFLSTKVNWIVLSIFVVKQVLIFPMCGMAAFVWPREHADHWYLQLGDPSWQEQAGEFWMKYMTYFILLSFMIPISLFVTLEMCKMAQFFAMRWDHHMLHFIQGVGWIGCRPKTSDLNDQLAVVRYVFTDKTGTLTENIMRYVQGAILSPRSALWVEHNEDIQPGSIGVIPALNAYATDTYAGVLSTANGAADDVVRYLSCMSMCHTVVPFTAPGEAAITYEGTSPDEVALVKAAAENGFELLKRTSKKMTVRIGGAVHELSILAELEFTPTRKMMSIVLEDEGGRVIVLTKGADSSVIKSLADTFSNRDHLASCQETVVRYARMQYRTLVFGYREVPMAAFEAWKATYDAVNTRLGKTEEELDAVCLKLETSLQLVGVAAYEDKLQDGVNETIKFLTDAGLTFWMLTGDKIETGIEIGKACGLAHDAEIISLYVKDAEVEYYSSSMGDTATLSSEQNSKLVEARVRREKEIILEAKMQAALEAVEDIDDGRRVCIAIDGDAFDVIEGQADGTLRSLFFKLSQFIHAAMCCRLTPAQKAYIVKMFQDETGETVLAIGDGANDATMISAATVGIGIIGLEGSQAELASDYAIPRFRHLTRLLAVHGRYAVYRNARCVCFSFYKNIVLSLCMVLYSSVSGFSGTAVFDSWVLAVKNTLFDFFPPFLIGCYGIDLSDEILMHPLYGPGLYKQMRTKELYCNPLTIGLWIFSALFHGVVIWFLCLPILQGDDVDPENGRQGGLIHTGVYMMTMVLVTVLAKAAMHIHQMTAVQASGIAVSFLLYPLFIVIYSALPSLFGDTMFHGMAGPLFADPKHYLLGFLAVVATTVVFDFTALYVQRHLFPTLRDAFADYYQYKDPPWGKERSVFGLWSRVAHGVVPVAHNHDGDDASVGGMNLSPPPQYVMEDGRMVPMAASPAPSSVDAASVPLISPGSGFVGGLRLPAANVRHHAAAETVPAVVHGDGRRAAAAADEGEDAERACPPSPPPEREENEGEQPPVVEPPPPAADNPLSRTLVGSPGRRPQLPPLGEIPTPSFSLPDQLASPPKEAPADAPEEPPSPPSDNNGPAKKISLGGVALDT
eukprot:TRINITY_DN5178_c0_g1_i2.p1 TRINITY_DN5178_c0_g1~~TRINITY_DN5178_c0_g1_i2.p1  ORF type:complete len:1396 (+),score=464.33 TRINITY_DN5178_c0_g1_i2:144-4331(+)